MLAVGSTADRTVRKPVGTAASSETAASRSSASSADVSAATKSYGADEVGHWNTPRSAEERASYPSSSHGEQIARYCSVAHRNLSVAVSEASGRSARNHRSAASGRPTVGNSRTRRVIRESSSSAPAESSPAKSFVPPFRPSLRSPSGPSGRTASRRSYGEPSGSDPPSGYSYSVVEVYTAVAGEEDAPAAAVTLASS